MDTCLTILDFCSEHHFKTLISVNIPSCSMQWILFFVYLDASNSNFLELTYHAFEHILSSCKTEILVRK